MKGTIYQLGFLADVYQLSSLLLDTLEILHSPLCSAWATPHVWLYVIKHYITTIKETVDESVSLFFFLCPCNCTSSAYS